MKFDLFGSSLETYQRLGGNLFQYRCPPLQGMSVLGAFNEDLIDHSNSSSCCAGYDQLGWPYRFPECVNVSSCACPTCWRASPIEASGTPGTENGHLGGTSEGLRRPLDEHPVLPAAAVAWAASSAVYGKTKLRYGMASKVAQQVAHLLGKHVGSQRVLGSEMEGSLAVGLPRHPVPHMCPNIGDWEVHMLNEEEADIHARVFKSPGAKLALVVFRGTKITSASNLEVDADIRRSRLSLGGDEETYVHEGFFNALEGVLPQVRAWANGNLLDLATQVPQDWTLVFAGHSLGGALALLATTQAEAQGWARKPNATIIFGSPRVADDNLDRWWRTRGLCPKLLRVNAYNDVVHWLPFVKRWKWWQVATSFLGCLADLSDCLRHGPGYNVRSGDNETIFSDRWTHVCNQSEVVVPSAMKGVNEQMEDFSALGGTMAHTIDNCLFGYGYGVLHGGVGRSDAYCGIGNDQGRALCQHDATAVD
jgi:hypothetical protein